MFRIGEFSKLAQVSIRMLRYYDEVGLLKPAEIDPWTGHRRYSAAQIPVLNRILYLRDSGFHVSEIADALDQEEEGLLAVLDRKHAEIEQAIQAEQEKLQKIELAKKELLHGKNKMYDDVSIKSIPSCQVLSLRRIIPNYYAEGLLWKEISAFAKQRQIQISGNPVSIYHDTAYKETNVDVELCVPVKKVGKNTGDFFYRTTEPVPAMACTMVYGDFSNIAGAYLAFAAWLEKNSPYQMDGATRQIVHRGPWNEQEAERYVIELQIPIKFHPQNIFPDPLASHTV